MTAGVEWWHFVLWAASVAGVVLNNHKRRECFYIWIATNTGWLLVDMAHGLYVQAALFATYLGLAIHDIWKWRTPAKDQEISADVKRLQLVDTVGR